MGIACSWSSCIDGFHPSLRPSRSSGRGGLPDELLEQFWQRASERLRQHAMWFLGTQLELTPEQLPDAYRARGFSYWERRIAAAKNSSDPDSFRDELGAIGQWCMRDQIDELWLTDQLLAMFQAGFVPRDAFSVVEWLAKISPNRVDRAVEVLALPHPPPSVGSIRRDAEPLESVEHSDKDGASCFA
jgi:hypothetical protein